MTIVARTRTRILNNKTDVRKQDAVGIDQPQGTITPNPQVTTPPHNTPDPKTLPRTPHTPARTSSEGEGRGHWGQHRGRHLQGVVCG